jgi:hypothetical protein
MVGGLSVPHFQNTCTLVPAFLVTVAFSCAVVAATPDAALVTTSASPGRVMNDAADPVTTVSLTVVLVNTNLTSYEVELSRPINGIKRIDTVPYPVPSVFGAPKEFHVESIVLLN